MIFNSEKVIKIKKDQYRYDISDDPYNKVFFEIEFGREFLVYRELKDLEAGVKEVVDDKRFPLTATGFSEATDYFEQIIAEQTAPKGGNPDGENNAPPIGILEVLEKSSISVKMFDGREGTFRKSEYSLKSNVLTISIDYGQFKNGERYYVDVIGSNPKILGIFPIGDVEGENASTNQNIEQSDLDEISEGGDPFDQASDGQPQPSPDGQPNPDGQPQPRPDGRPNPDGQPQPTPDGEPIGEFEDGEAGADVDYGEEEDNDEDPPLEQKVILANSYGFATFEQLVNLFGDKESVLDNVLSMDDMEKSGLLSKLAINYDNPSQFESVMRRIILT